MYNKIASIILNSAKSSGLSDVFVAQPDSIKENLAGKIFILAEISDKKTDGRKIFDFLTRVLSDNYYNDENILFRGKIESLKIESIFEAAIAKTNKNLNDFLLNEKIKINPASTNLTVGVIFENKLYFTSFGHNRAILIYQHGAGYEIINVESSATEINDDLKEEGEIIIKTPKLFSSVVSGEIPLNSYFIFTSEALPEYLSNNEMVKIITKLPPMTAAEQIKNVLLKINTYVPFLGIIIKNTAGSGGTEPKEEIDAQPSSAHGSISSLNYTEQKTEQMLAPAGLVNFSKIIRQIKGAISSLIPEPNPRNSKRYNTGEEKSSSLQSVLDLGSIKSLNTAKADSFFIKDKIFFKKKSNYFYNSFKRLGANLVNVLDPKSWKEFFFNIQKWSKNLNFKNRLLFISLGLFIVIFALSLIITKWTKENNLKQENLKKVIAAIEEKENSINSHLLYGDESGAVQFLIEAQANLSLIPQKTAAEKDAYKKIEADLKIIQDKIQKIVKVENTFKIADLSGLNANNIIFAGDKFYAAGKNIIHTLSSTTPVANKIIDGADELSRPSFDNDKIISYSDGQKIIRFNIKTNEIVSWPLNDPQQATSTSFKVYNSSLYILSSSQNQILKYRGSANQFSGRTAWLSETADLSQAKDIFIDSSDGRLYVIKNNGEIMKFFKGKRVDFKSPQLLPAATSIDKFIIGSKYIYLFEASSKRLILIDKNSGQLINQYEAASLVQPKDFAIDEGRQIAYFLDNDALVSITLNK